MNRRAAQDIGAFLNQIASHYAGRPTTVHLNKPKPGTPDGAWGSGGWGGTLFQGDIYLGPYQAQQLRAFMKNPKAKTGPGTVAGLAVLIHEALHGRSNQPGTGFSDWSNERQANALGSELVPDALQRFFGIKIGSPLSNAWLKAAKNLSGYVGAYSK